MKIPHYLLLILITGFLLNNESKAQHDLRLLFSYEDIPCLRLKMENEPYASMYKVLERKATESPVSEYEHVYFAINNSFLYTLTGENRFSDSALRAVKYLINLDDWANDDFRSLGRAMYAKGVSLAYDMCKNAWSYETDTLISGKLVEMGASLKRSGGKGWPSGHGNNWRAVRFSGMGLCYLSADYLDNSVREAEVNYAFDQVVSYFDANLSEQENAMGWNPEGIGYIIYPAEFWGIFNIAIGRSYPEKNFSHENEAVKHTLSTIYRGSILKFRDAHNKGYHPDFSDDNMSIGGSGVPGLAFKNSADEYIPALKWFYNRLVGEKGDKSFDSERGGVMFSYLYFPQDIEEKNPEEIFGLNYVDPAFGMLIYRNEYNDSCDIVAQHNAKERSPKHCHGGADANGIRIWGLGGCWTTGAGRIGSKGSPGQTTVLRYDPDEQVPKDNSNGKLRQYEFFDKGSGYSVIEGSSTSLPYHQRVFVSDFSGLSDSPALFVISDSTVYGKYWRLNTLLVNTVETIDSGFIITAPNGSRLVGKIVQGDPESFRTGTFERGSGYTWDGQSYDTNRWMDFQSKDRNYLVILMLLRKSTPIPDIKYSSEGNIHTIIAGNRVIQIRGDDVSFFTMEEWLKITDVHDLKPDNTSVKIYPNPGNERVLFSFSSESHGFLSAKIYNEQGSMLNVLHEGRINSGRNDFEWMAGSRKGCFFLKYSINGHTDGEAKFILL